MKGRTSRLTIKSFHVTHVTLGKKTSLASGSLTIDETLFGQFLPEFVEKAEIKIIQPHEHNVYVNSIMDFVPVATKVLGKLGSGITHTLTGCYFMLTGCDTDGRQIGGFGTSEGILKDQVIFGKAGTPSKEDFIVHIDVLIDHQVPFDRKVAYQMYQICDQMIQDIRDLLKMKNGLEADERYDFEDPVFTGMPKVAIIKQVSGQGAMYDNLLFPNEPSGTIGGVSIIDMNNMPVMLTPNEYRDGALRALS